jgi:hypothetical protein
MYENHITRALLNAKSKFDTVSQYSNIVEGVMQTEDANGKKARNLDT